MLVTRQLTVAISCRSRGKKQTNKQTKKNYESPWGPWTVWTPTFFKRSYFVFNIKKLVQVWNNLAVS